MTAQNNGSQTMVCACVCTCVFPRLMSGTCLYSFLCLLLLFESGLCWNLELSGWLGKLTGGSRVLLSLCSQGRFTDVCHQTRLFTWVLNTGTQVCTARISSAEPSSQLQDPTE